MKKSTFALIAIVGLSLGAAAIEDDDLNGQLVSTDTARQAEEEDDEQAVIQESDSDLAAFVHDYIAKDYQLRGAFFIESPDGKKILKLKLVSIAEKTKDAPGGAKTITALFTDAAGKRYEVLFYLQSSSFGGAEISKIELKQKPATGARSLSE